MDGVVIQISRLGGDIDNNDESHSLFDSRPLHAWVGNLKGIPKDWVLPKADISGAIIIWHIVFQWNRVTNLKLLQTCHINHITRRLANFKRHECFIIA